MTSTKLDREIAAAWTQYQACANPQDIARLRQRYDTLVEARDARRRDKAKERDTLAVAETAQVMQSALKRVFPQEEV